MKPNQIILLVEDEPDEVFFIRRALSKDHIQNPLVVVRNDGEAIKYLEGTAESKDEKDLLMPGAILTDDRMPRINALAILEWMKAHPDIDIIPTIILTATKRNERVKKAYDLGVHAYIVKPSEPHALQEILKDTCNFWSWCETPEPKKP